ncbi:uncharacterized protein LOC129752540 [Uranotaenia lowii]|uniref:uncharacterized protein LOC129752540 n=1 Tax=Uranotaenia lowii TaxID=190385 RepID=UPI002479A46D|nr:uncharacterized protein LOC129752540 [Uranotaenia lowii]
MDAVRLLNFFNRLLISNISIKRKNNRLVACLSGTYKNMTIVILTICATFYWGKQTFNALKGFSIIRNVTIISTMILYTTIMFSLATLTISGVIRRLKILELCQRLIAFDMELQKVFSVRCLGRYGWIKMEMLLSTLVYLYLLWKKLRLLEQNLDMYVGVLSEVGRLILECYLGHRLIFCQLFVEILMKRFEALASVVKGNSFKLFLPLWDEILELKHLAAYVFGYTVLVGCIDALLACAMMSYSVLILFQDTGSFKFILNDVVFPVFIDCLLHTFIWFAVSYRCGMIEEKVGSQIW